MGKEALGGGRGYRCACPLDHEEIFSVDACAHDDEDDDDDLRDETREHCNAIAVRY